MSQKCIKCGSYAINVNHHGRKPNTDTDLCDVCYWRKRADGFEDFTEKINYYDKIKNMSINEIADYIVKRRCIDCGHEKTSTCEKMCFNEEIENLLKEAKA